MSWPYGETECPRCRYLEPLEPPVRDDAGYEIVGLCLHPRIAMELFRMKTRATVENCPCFVPRREAAGDEPRRGREDRHGAP